MRRLSAVLTAMCLTACPSDRRASSDQGTRVREVQVATEPGPGLGATPARPHGTRGQKLYLPVYSSVFGEDERLALEMTVTVTVRNTSHAAMTLHALDYVGAKGGVLERVVVKPVELGPLETREYVIRRSDRRGGRGANFMVEWHAPGSITPPLVQAAHVYLGGTQAFAFVTNAVLVEDDLGPAEEP